jgi:hypothetical protein
MKKFDTARNSTLHHEEIRPCIMKKFNPASSRNSTLRRQEIRPLRLKKFDPCVVTIFDLAVVMIFDPFIATIFDLAVAVIFDPSSPQSSTPPSS